MVATFFAISFLIGLLIYAEIFIINVIRRNSVLQVQQKTSRVALKIGEKQRQGSV